MASLMAHVATTVATKAVMASLMASVATTVATKAVMASLMARVATTVAMKAVMASLMASVATIAKPGSNNVALGMFLTQNEIDYIKDLLDDRYDQDLMLSEFREVMREEFGVKVICFFCDHAGKSLYKNRLRFVVSDSDRGVFLKPPWSTRDLVKEEKVKALFSNLCVKHKRHEEFSLPSEYFAIASEYETDFRCDVICACTQEMEGWLKTVQEVKKTSSFAGNYYIFYERDEDIKKYAESGLSEEIAEHLFGIIKAHDEYGVFKERRIFFDSVQTLNEKYAGSLFYYHR